MADDRRSLPVFFLVSTRVPADMLKTMAYENRKYRHG
jgi:hypothetical protein